MRLTPLLLASSILLAACGSGGQSSSSSSSVAADPLSIRYEKVRDAFAIDYPVGWLIEEDSMIVTDEYELVGSAFVMPTAELRSKLLDVRFHVGIQERCPFQNDPDVFMTDSGLELQRSEWSGAAAGNLYEGAIYTHASNPMRCYVLTAYLHSCNLGDDCGPDHSRNFNRSAAFDAFDSIARSFELM